MKKVLMLAAIIVMFSATASLADAERGKEIFNSKSKGKCAVCHKFGKKKVGPDLAGVMNRAPEEWVRKWLADPPAVWSGDDPYTLEMKKRIKKEKKKRTSHKTPKLSAQMIDDLIDYLKTK